MWALNGLVLVLIIGLNVIVKVPAEEVTHEEIRGTIQSLIYSYNQLDNKLERHEHRTRALGELLKKAMQTLQKGQKNLEPINGIFTRLDERVSQIETMLITQEEKYNLQTEKLGEALEHIFKWMRENDECLKRPPTTSNTVAVTSAPQISTTVPNEFVAQQQEINKELLDQIKLLSSNVEKLLGNTKNIMEQTSESVTSNEILIKIEDKLNKASGKDKQNEEFKNTLLNKFGEIANNITELRKVPTTTSEGLTTADREFIESLRNETTSALELIKNDAQITSKNIDMSIKKLFSEVNSSKDILKTGLESFDKVNNILMSNSEYVQEIQRKVEFGTLTTVQKIGNLIDKHVELIKERFDQTDENVFGTQLESVKNLSSFIESEISHVWHQIEIMNGEISDSKDLLNLVQKRNEVYVSSSFNTMDGLSSKVEETKGRMLDMDSNLNYLLGKLSVMSQEFKNIKMGLAESLDELRRTFHSMQEKMPQENSNSNGPHTIDKNEYETELNLLNKRHATQTDTKE